MNSVYIKILILMGLPASGKTTYALDLLKDSKGQVNYIDFDDLLLRYKSEAIKHLSKKIKNLIDSSLYFYNQGIKYSKETYIIDGLIHTNQQLYEVIQIINEVINNTERGVLVKSLIEIEINYWNENRKQCLINDKNRRKRSSKLSIKHLVLDKPDLEKIKVIFPRVSIKYHEVNIKPDWLIFANKYNLDIDREHPYLISKEWCLGGSYGNCWNDSIETIQPDEVLTEFKEFDDLLLSICPDISFSTYRDIKQKTCSLKERNEKDYYSGTGSNYAYYQCDIPLLYTELIQLNLIKNK